MVAGTTSSSSAGGRGIGRSYWPNAALGQVADHRAGCHAEHHRADHLARGHRADRSTGRARRSRCRRGRGAQRRGQPLEQRPVGVEGALRPLRPADGAQGDDAAGGRRRQAGDVGHVQLGHPRQLLDVHALERVDVALRLAVGGDPGGHLAGDVPVDRPRPAQHLGQVAEDRQPRERVVAAPSGPGTLTQAMVGPMGTIAVSGVAGHLGGPVLDALRAAGEEW